MFKIDLRRIDTKRPLGYGRFGTTYPYLEEKAYTSSEVVVKCLRFKTMDELRFLTQELVLGFRHKHPFVVSTKGFDYRDSPENDFFLFIKMPRMEKSLKNVIGQHMRAKTKPHLKDIIKYFYTVANGLEYLQRKGIVHNNVNPATILIDHDNTAKIGEIGFAQLKPWKEGDAGLGTLIYAAPEKLDRYFFPRKKIVFKGDVWSLGVTIIEFCLLGKIKRFYPPDDDDFLGLDEESEPKEEKKAPEIEKKKNESDLDSHREEEKVNVERVLKAGDVLIEENLRAIEKEYLNKPDDVEGPERILKLIEILRKTLQRNPQKRASFRELLRDLEKEFSELLLPFCSLRNLSIEEEEEEEEEMEFLFYCGGQNDEDSESATLILADADEVSLDNSFSEKANEENDEESSQKILKILISNEQANSSNPSVTQENNLNLQNILMRDTKK